MPESVGYSSMHWHMTDNRQRPGDQPCTDSNSNADIGILVLCLCIPLGASTMTSHTSDVDTYTYTYTYTYTCTHTYTHTHTYTAHHSPPLHQSATAASHDFPSPKPARYPASNAAGHDCSCRGQENAAQMAAIRLSQCNIGSSRMGGGMAYAAVWAAVGVQAFAYQPERPISERTVLSIRYEHPRHRRRI